MRRFRPAGILVLILAGCSPGWHLTDPTPGDTLPPRDQYLIHHGGVVDRWHAVQVSDDSVTGVPWLQPIDCDSCRVALPQTTVDSIRTGHPVAGFWKGYALFVYGPPILLSAFCVLSGYNPGCWVIPST